MKSFQVDLLVVRFRRFAGIFISHEKESAHKGFSPGKSHSQRVSVHITLQKGPNPPPLSKTMSGHDLLLSRIWGHRQSHFKVRFSIDKIFTYIWYFTLKWKFPCPQILDDNRSWTDTVLDPMSFMWRIWAFLQCDMHSSIHWKYELGNFQMVLDACQYWAV